MKGSGPEWANQKQITSHVSYLQMFNVGHNIILVVHSKCSVRGMPGYTSCKGFFPTAVKHILWQVLPRNIQLY